MHFFGSDLRFSNQFYRRDRNAYLAEFGTCKDEPLIGEASVWYLFSRFAADEIKAFNPDARIIIMLRNPVPLLHSLYCAFSADGNEHLPTFREAMAAEGERQLGLGIGRQAYLPQALVYRSTVRFTEQVRRYFNVFGRDRVQVIIYDDFSSNTAEVYRKTLEFLGAATNVAPPSFVPVNANVNGNQSVKSPTMRAILNDPFVRGGGPDASGLAAGAGFFDDAKGRSAAKCLQYHHDAAEASAVGARIGSFPPARICAGDRAFERFIGTRPDTLERPGGEIRRLAGIDDTAVRSASS